MQGLPRARLAAATALLICGTVPVAAEVIDLGNGDARGRVTASVLDFGKPMETPEAKVAARVQEVAVLPEASTLAGPRGPVEIEDLIMTVGQRYAGHPGLRRAGIAPMEWLALFRANIAIESNFRQSARSHAGAIGLGQLMPATARTLGVDPHDARENLHGSARYLLMQLEAFGSVELALAAYNAGPEAVRRHRGIPPYRETRGHVRKVLSIYHTTTGKEST